MRSHEGEKLLSIRIEEVEDGTGLPVIVTNLTIFGDLTFKAHNHGILVPYKKTDDITSRSSRLSTMTETLNVLARLKSLEVTAVDEAVAAAGILDSLAEHHTSDVAPVAKFAAEQLRPAVKQSSTRRYSSGLLSTAIVWDRVSPKLYQMMQKSPFLCMPHTRTLRRLTSALQVDAGLDCTTKSYLSMRIATLEPRERLVNIAMDEVYTAQSVEVAGGKYYGEINGVLTKTLFCIHMNSVFGKYEDMVSMQPVAHVRKDDIEDSFNRVLQGVTELGFVVVSVTTDNHRVNQSWHNSLGTDGRHPEYITNPYSDQEDQRIYTMYDSVHAFKNVYYGLMRAKAMTLPPFPGLDNPQPLKVDFSHLIRLHNMERGDPAKLAFKLTDRVLHPSVLERVNVSLAAAATHQSTSAALQYFAEKKSGCAEFAGTAVFLKLVRRWFDSCNVKSPLMWIRMNDRHRVPLRSGCEDSERTIAFLREFGDYVRDLSANGMPRDTCMAVYHTCRGLTGLAEYLLTKRVHGVEYVLLGKIQSDGIENHFGHLRKLSGGNYWLSVRQFFENEAVIRIKGLVWWSGVPVGQIVSTMAPAQQEHRQRDAETASELAASVAGSEDESELHDSAKAALGHIAGYLAHSATKWSKCASCASVLVERNADPVSVTMEPSVVSTFVSFSALLDRGKLLVPSATAVSMTLHMCHIWRQLINVTDTREKLLCAYNPRQVFVDTVAAVCDDGDAFEVTCEESHGLSALRRRMASALFSLFAGNMARDVNSEAHNKKRRHKSTSSRSQVSDKRRKLSGEKKA